MERYLATKGDNLCADAAVTVLAASATDNACVDVIADERAASNHFA